MKRMRGSDLNLKERAVLIAQYSYADRDGTNSYVSETTLAKDLGIGVSTLREHRRVLRDEKGWLVRRHRGVNIGSGGDSRASTYEVVIPRPSATVEDSALDTSATAVCLAVANESNDVTESATAKFSAEGQLATAESLAPTGLTEDRGSSLASNPLGVPKDSEGEGTKPEEGTGTHAGNGSSSESAPVSSTEGIQPSTSELMHGTSGEGFRASLVGSRDLWPESFDSAPCTACGNEVYRDDDYVYNGYLKWHSSCPQR
jgi:hypothetical protein